MTSAPTILPNDPNIPEYLDFNKLREEGISHLAELSGRIWTDHNLHDPGITILEVLCYALIDLGYRNTLDPEELLAPAAGETEDNFFTPARILGSNPLTILDYRKLLIDIEGVRNAWLVPANEQEVELYASRQEDGRDVLQFTPPVSETEGSDPAGQEVLLNGLYKVYLELDSNLTSSRTSATCGEEAAGEGVVLQRVLEQLHQFRNLCEDFLDPVVLKDEQIGLCADIELEPDADPEDVLVDILTRLQNFLSPGIKFYTLKEMLEAGKTIEEIFEGRPLTEESHGFIIPDDLAKRELKKELYTSDFYREIMKVKGVVAVKKKLKLYSYIDGECQIGGEPWCLPLRENYRPVLAPELSEFTFHKGVLQFKADAGEVAEQFQKRLSGLDKARLPAHKLDLEIPYGRHREDLGEYLSIQHDFPLTYRIGEGEMPANASNQRKAQALQLKGYLLFFDQLLANYLAQLAHVRDLFSLTPDSQRDTSKRFTYFAQEAASVPDLEKLLVFYQNGSSRNLDEGTVLAHSPVDMDIRTAERRDAILREVQLAFDNNEVVAGTQPDPEGFRFVVRTNAGRPLLISADRYPTEAQALEKINLVSFLGAIAKNYRETYNRETGSFGFELVYFPVNYLSYLQGLLENEEKYRERRDHFLNHLLARFSEDFTDYVLLMYALYGKRPPLERIVEDKANLLSRYDEISRDRSRAYNYLDQERLWNCENVSGLEKRVSGLIGIKDFSRTTLSHFEITRREALYYLHLEDVSGNLLFRTTQGWEEAGGAEAEKNVLTALAAEWDRYRPYDCPAEQVYGFELLNEGGKVYAVHPHTYGSGLLRDRKMACTHLMVKDAGLIHRVVASEDTYYFYLYNDEGSKLLFVSSNGYPTREEAWDGWHRFVEVLLDEDNTRKFFIDDFQGERFTVVVRERRKGLWEDLARYVTDFFYDDGDDPDEILPEVVDEIPQKQLFYQFFQLPTLYNWQINDEEGNFLAGSTFRYERQDRGHVYKSIDQAADSFFLFMDFATQRRRYSIEVDDAGYYFTVLNEDANQVARSVYFDTFQTCEAAIEDLIAFIGPLRNRVHQRERPNLANYLRRVTKRIKFLSREGLYSFSVEFPEGRPALSSVHNFTTLPEAYEAFYRLLAAACREENYVDTTSEDGCLLGFEVWHEGELLAFHPDYYLYETPDDIPEPTSMEPAEEAGEGTTEGEADPEAGEEETPTPEPPPTRSEVREALREYICDNQYTFDISGKWYFEILCEDCEEVAVTREPAGEAEETCTIENSCRPILLGTGRYHTQAEAETAYRTFRNTLLVKKSAVVIEDQEDSGPGAYGFVVRLGEGGETLAESLPLTSVEERNWLMSQSRHCLEKFYNYYPAPPYDPLGLEPEAITRKERIEPYDDHTLCVYSVKGKLTPESDPEVLLEGVKGYANRNLFNGEFWDAALNPDPEVNNYFLVRSAVAESEFPESSFSYGLKRGNEVLAIIPGRYTLTDALQRYEEVAAFAVANEDALRSGGYWRFRIRIVHQDGTVVRTVSMVEIFEAPLPSFVSRNRAEAAFRRVVAGLLVPEVVAGTELEVAVAKLNTIWDSLEGGRSDTFLKAEYFITERLVTHEVTTACRIEQNWGFELLWPGIDAAPDSDSEPAEPFLVSPPGQRFEKPSAAEAALDHLMAVIEAEAFELSMVEKKKKNEEGDEVTSTTEYSFELTEENEGPTLAVYHHYTPDETEPDQVMQFARDHFLRLLPSNPNKEAFRWVRLEVPPIDPPGKARPKRARLVEKDCSFFSGYRLIKNEDVIARHPQVYPAATLRDNAFHAIFEKAANGEAPYLPLTVFYRSRRRSDDLYHLVVRTEDQALWWGTATFEDKAAADAAGLSGHIAIMHLARRRGHYRVEGDVIRLVDPEAGPLAEIPERTTDAARREALIQERISAAWAFPLFEQDGRLGYRLYEEATRESVWESTRRYDTYEAVKEAYGDFLVLLQYRSNHRIRDDVHAGNYRLELGEVLLESAHVFRENNPARLNAWEWCFGVKSLLQSAQNDRSYYTFVDYENDCRSGFRIVEEAYRVAVHPHYYPTLAERECKRDQLFEWASCNAGSLFSQVEVGTCAMGDHYHFTIKLAEAIEIAGLKKPLLPKDEVLWRSYAGFPAKDDARKAGDQLLLQIMNNAREPEFYVFSEVSDHLYRAVLTDDQGNYLAVIPQMEEEFEDLLASVQFRMLAARMYPYTWCDGKYGFQLYRLETLSEPEEADPWEVHDETTGKMVFAKPVVLPYGATYRGDERKMKFTLGGEIAWESVTFYDALDQAQSKFRKLVEETGSGTEGCADISIDGTKLIKEKSNYQRTERESCGPFGLEITDPNHVVARHPRLYDKAEKLTNAIARTKACINAEGLHLLEHLLLRPRHGLPEKAVEPQAYQLFYHDRFGKTQPLLDLVFHQAETGETSFAETLTGHLLQVLPEVMNGIDIPAMVGEMKERDELPDDGPARCAKVIQALIGQVVCSAKEYDFSTLSWPADLQKKYGSLEECFEAIRMHELLQKIPFRVFCTDEGQEPYLDIAPGFWSPEILNWLLGIYPAQVGPEEAPPDRLMPICPDWSAELHLQPDFAEAADPCATPAGEDEADGEECLSYIPGIDPYSFWVTVVIPFWPQRFQNTNFREFFENTLRKEAPAHVALRICWIDPRQMKEFERRYLNWLQALSGTERCDYRQAHYDIVEYLEQLRNVYPPATLSESGSGGSPVVIGKTSLS